MVLLTFVVDGKSARVLCNESPDVIDLITIYRWLSQNPCGEKSTFRITCAGHPDLLVPGRMQVTLQALLEVFPIANVAPLTLYVPPPGPVLLPSDVTIQVVKACATISLKVQGGVPISQVVATIISRVESEWVNLKYQKYEIHHDNYEKPLTDEHDWFLCLSRKEPKVVIKLLSKPHSDFTSQDWHEYFELDWEPQENKTEFKQVKFEEDESIDVGSEKMTIGALLDLTASWLSTLGAAYQTVTLEHSEYTRREFISPFLAAAILIAGGACMRAEFVVDGLRSHGRVDYAAIYGHYHLLLSEAKKEKLEDGVPQVCAEIASSRYMSLRNQEGIAEDRGIKRKMADLDILLPISTTALLTNGQDFIFYRYIPSKGEEPRRIIRSEVFGAIIEPSRCTLQSLKIDVRTVVGRLVGALQFQKKEIDDAIPATKRSRTGASPASDAVHAGSSAAGAENQGPTKDGAVHGSAAGSDKGS